MEPENWYFNWIKFSSNLWLCAFLPSIKKYYSLLIFQIEEKQQISNIVYIILMYDIIIKDSIMETDEWESSAPGARKMHDESHKSNLHLKLFPLYQLKCKNKWEQAEKKSMWVERKKKFG